MDILTDRALISFDDICPYQCKHCYTLDIPRKPVNRSMEEIVDSISTCKFDIVYISQRRENFVDPNVGIELCEMVFKRYKCNIFIITRNVFENEHILKLKKLKEKMEMEGKHLFVAVSVFATHSYMQSENPNIVPSPYERISFLKTLAEEGFFTITLIRPVFPKKIIPIEELYEIVDLCKCNANSCVVSSGLAVNANILWRLGVDKSDFDYISNSHYLEGAMEGVLDFIDVTKELSLLKEYCSNVNVPFFEHTISALNYLLRNDKIGV